MQHENTTSKNLYSAEEEILRKASYVLHSPDSGIETIKEEFSALIDSYSKLIRQTKKLVTISDRTQDRLNQVSREKSEAYDELNKVYSQLKEDLIFARTIQQNILPKKPHFADLDICTWYKPMIEVGGDIYDIEEIAPGHVRIFLADATGHGVQAALITMIIKSEYEKIKHTAGTPAEVMGLMNRMLFDVYSNLKQNFTAFTADIILNEKKITFASAGHPDQYAVIDGKLEKLKAKGIILGFMEDCSYQLGKLDFNDSFKLFLFTDGLYEEFDDNLNEYGIERVKSMIDHLKQNSAEQITREIMEDILNYSENGPLNDDILFICAENTPS